GALAPFRVALALRADHQVVKVDWRCRSLQTVRVIELHDDDLAAEAFVVIDHELFPLAAGGTRMLPDVDRGEVARLARAMTWKFAVCRMPCAGAKAGIRFSGGDRNAVLAAYRRALEPYR